jgi:uncharacterized protein (UPF0371 family)
LSRAKRIAFVTWRLRRRGISTYFTSRITSGYGYSTLSERNLRSRLASTISAFSETTRTIALLTATRATGSKLALSVRHCATARF